MTKAAKLIEKLGFAYYYVDAGGDIQVSKTKADGTPWKVGIRNPFQTDQIVKTLSVSDCGVATSGTYERGSHIYNPKDGKPMIDILSLTVIGPNVYEADRFATAAFAMGKEGIHFLERLPGFEGYLIDRAGVATMTSGFERFVQKIC